MELKATQYKVLKDITENDYKKRIIAMDTGTGKTIVGLMLIALYHKPKHKTLIICPPILINNVWIPENKVFGIYDGEITAITSKNIKDRRTAGVYAISYNMFAYHSEKIKKYKWDMIILDESHYIGNRGSVRTKAIIGKRSYNKFINKLESNRTYLLTGTLIPNNEEQIYSQLVAVGLDWSWTQFKDTFFSQPVPTMFYFLKFKERMRKEFNKLVQQYTTVVTKEETDLKDIAKNFNYITFSMPEKISKIQHDLIKHKLYKHKSKIKEDNYKVTLDYNIKKFVKLRQLASGFIKDDKDEIRPLTNIRCQMFNEFIKDRVNDKYIIWYGFEYDRLALEALCKDNKYNYKVLKGGLTAKKQKDILDWFKKEDTGLLFIQHNVGKVGLTLTETNNMIYYNLADDNEFYQQSQNRIHRYSQNKDCNYYILQQRGSIDDAIVKSLERKDNMVEGLKAWLKEQEV